MSRHTPFRQRRTEYWVGSYRGDTFVSPNSPPSELNDPDYYLSPPSDVESSHSDPPQMILRYDGRDDHRIRGPKPSRRSHDFHDFAQKDRRHRSRRSVDATPLSQPEDIHILPADYPSPAKHGFKTSSRNHGRHGSLHRHPELPRREHQFPSAAAGFIPGPSISQFRSQPADWSTSGARRKRSEQQQRPVGPTPTMDPRQQHTLDRSHQRRSTQQYNATARDYNRPHLSTLPTGMLYSHSDPLPHQYRHDNLSVYGRSLAPESRARAASEVHLANPSIRNAVHRRQMNVLDSTGHATPINPAIQNSGSLPYRGPVTPHSEASKKSFFQRIKQKIAPGSDSSKRSDRSHVSRLQRRHSTDNFNGRGRWGS